MLHKVNLQNAPIILYVLDRYVTIQRYGFVAVGDTRLQLEEVDIVVYCEGYLSEDVCPEPPPDDCDTQLPCEHVCLIFKKFCIETKNISIYYHCEHRSIHSLEV